MAKVLLGRSLRNPEFESEQRQAGLEALGCLADLEFYEGELTGDDVEGVAGVIASSATIHPAFYERGEELRIIARWGVGYEKTNLSVATESGVMVTISPEHMQTVAEYAVTQWLATMKRVYSLNLMSHGGDFSIIRTFEIDGSTLGIYGFGRIGQEVAKRAVPLLGESGRLLVYDIRPDIEEAAGSFGAEVATSPDQLFQECDTVTIHVSGADPVVTYDLLKQMQPHASLINPSRGTLVNDVDVNRALEEGLLTYYVVDDPVDGPREIHKGHPRVICTNHNAGMTDRSADRLDACTMGQVTAALEGRQPDHLLNPEVLEHPRVKGLLSSD